MQGTYLLVLALHKDASIKIGRHGTIYFKKGYYVYIGSALNGLDQRIQRHLRKNKKIHWHIDYFLPYTKIINVFYKENIHKEECKIAQLFKKNYVNIPKFGCSDCCCKSHLFYGSLKQFLQTVKALEMKIYLKKENS